VALTLGQSAQIVANVNYQARIRAAVVRSAIAVSTEVQGALSQNAWMRRRQLATRVLNGPDQWITAFTAAVAADPNAALTWFAPVSIASSTNANPIVITTAAVHSLTTGDIVEIANHLVNTNANGVWTVTVVTTTTFSILQAGNGVGGATGTVMRMETDTNLVNTVSSVFSAIAGLLPGE
jgi:hypothetical protein